MLPAQMQSYARSADKSNIIEPARLASMKLRETAGSGGSIAVSINSGTNADPVGLTYRSADPAAQQRLSQKFFYVMGGAKAKVNPVGRTRLRTAAKANSFCHHRAS